MARLIGIVSDHYRVVQNDELLAMASALAGPDSDAGRCEHEDWDRTIVDWVRCVNPATVTVYAGDEAIRVCDADAVYYD